MKLNTLNRILRVMPGYLSDRFLKGKKLQYPPTFIVGCGHSGTSLLLAILGTHSRFYAVPSETSVGFRKYWKMRLHLWLFDMTAVRAGKSGWIEKTPRHIYCIGKFLEIRPDSRFILMVRDGRDVACSIQDRTGSLEEGVRRWIDDNEAGRQFWQHPNVYVIKYEGLIEDFEGTMRSLLSFLGADFEPSLREYHKTPKRYYSEEVAKPPTPQQEHHRQYRNWQINQPIFDGRGKWKRMTDEEKRLVKDLAGEMLVAYGYAKDNNW
ncbi:MAG: sulfotransferase family protein [Nitrospirota bacterium]